jgi:hypothetical protein
VASDRETTNWPLASETTNWSFLFFVVREPVASGQWPVINFLLASFLFAKLLAGQ